MALTISALRNPQLRVLHFLQAFIYVAILILARRNSVWGLGAGVTIGVVWNSISFFISHLMQAGAVALWSSVRTGHLRGIDEMVVLIGSIGHFVLIAACLTALFNQTIDKKKWWEFAGGGALAFAYFALIVAVARPR
ncbi:MAG TPA: hypothetical protein VGD64_15750 [Acidisarcina sp.]